MLNRLMILSVSLLLVFQTGLKAQVDLGPVQELILKEKFQEASKMLDGFIGEKPKNLDRVYFYLGQIAYLQEDFAGAKKFFETGLETKSKSPLNLAGMGMIKMKDQLYTDAYEFLEKAVSFAKGKDPEAAYAVADAYLEGGPQEIGEAKKILYQRRQSDEEDPRTYIKLGEYYKKQGVPELAIEELEKAIQKKADYVPAYVGLAELYYNRGKETRSGADFQTGYKYANKAIELNPDFGPAYRIRAELYLISQFPDKFERGKKDMEKYLSLQNNDEQAKVRYAQFLFLTEDYDNSLKAIGELESAGATNNVLRRLKGMALAEKGQLGPAQAALDDYFSKMDEKYRISQDYEVYGDILRMQGNLEKADEYYVEAMKRSDDRDGLFGEIADDYKGSAKSVEDEVKAIKAEANTFQGQAQTFYGEYQKIASMEAPTEEDAAKAADFRAKMDEAVAAGKAKLAEADAKSAEAKPFYLNEAHYRQKALEMADPVTLTHYRNLLCTEKWPGYDS
ncbi:MAG: hypothetical protein AAFP92_09475, partial [Bacteroidota bacterium]